MTVSSDPFRNDYIGTGSVDTYSYGFRIFAESDLVVTQVDTSGIETTLVLNTDYTVTGVGAAVYRNAIDEIVVAAVGGTYGFVWTLKRW